MKNSILSFMSIYEFILEKNKYSAYRRKERRIENSSRENIINFYLI
jgi:hypothetical protein